jgi:hypothetical protein
MALAIAYIIYKIQITYKSAGDPCYGCKGCALHEQMKKEKYIKNKKPKCYDKSNKKIL